MRSLHPTRWPLLFVFVLIATSLTLQAASCRSLGEWPRRFDSIAGSFVVYQPQPEDLQGDLLTGRMAFSLRKAGQSGPTFGVLWFRARVEVDRDSSTVDLREFDVTLVRMPGIAPEDAQLYEKLVEGAAQDWDLHGSLPELQAGLAASARERLSADGLDHQPPRIVMTFQRSLLVCYDGDPVLEPIEGTSLQRVTNTPYAVVFDPGRGTYYLAGANLWYSAADPLGPWSVTQTPPDEVVAAVPPDTTATDAVAGPPPAVVTATVPTELISFDGEPLLEPLVGNHLLYATNTEGDVLRDEDTRQVYVLLSGRWYVATSEQGPWTYVPPDQLPDVFRQIPPDSPKAALLATVPGTSQADDAVADDEIPQTTAVRRDDHDVQVLWDGAPQFEIVPGTSLQYGVNTDAEVLYDGQHYFLCDQGVWYVADTPDGPWSVSADLPPGLDGIAPDCPVYNVRYTDIYEVTPTVVYVGYLPGYLGYYPYGGTVVYGTGVRYKPWHGPHHYFPRFPTWGFHARYDPWLARWSFGTSYGMGFLHVGARWHFAGRPVRDRSDVGWFGPGGFHRPWLASDHSPLRVRPPRLHPHVDDYAPSNLYSRGENQGRTVRTKPAPAAAPVPVRTQAAPIANNVFAGRDGKVYQRRSSGQWRVNDGGRWVPTPMPNTPATPAAPVTQPGGGGGRGWTPSGSQGAQRPAPQAMPVQPATPSAPSSAPARPRAFPRIMPAPPTPAASPGRLESEFQARQRAATQSQPRPSAPASRAEPRKQEPAPGGQQPRRPR